MTMANISIYTDSELATRAQSVLAGLGLDLSTAFNIFLTRVVKDEALPFEVDQPKVVSGKRPRSELWGCMEGQIWMEDDFDAPLEEMREYME